MRRQSTTRSARACRTVASSGPRPRLPLCRRRPPRRRMASSPSGRWPSRRPCCRRSRVRWPRQRHGRDHPTFRSSSSTAAFSAEPALSPSVVCRSRDFGSEQGEVSCRSYVCPCCSVRSRSSCPRSPSRAMRPSVVRASRVASPIWAAANHPRARGRSRGRPGYSFFVEACRDRLPDRDRLWAAPRAGLSGARGRCLSGLKQSHAPGRGRPDDDGRAGAPAGGSRGER